MVAALRVANAAAGLAERPLWAHNGRQLAAPGIDGHDRYDGEGRTVEYDLTDRIARAEKAHQGRHHGEQNRRDQLEHNTFAGIRHVFVASGSRDLAARELTTRESVKPSTPLRA